ncbi:unnamed protein product, partial [Prorocentrum cordatum]
LLLMMVAVENKLTKSESAQASPPSTSPCPPAARRQRILEVWEQPGNVRLAEFQDTGSFESRVHCRGNAPTCPAADPSAATDVAACAACPCELDDSRDTSESRSARSWARWRRAANLRGRRGLADTRACSELRADFLDRRWPPPKTAPLAPASWTTPAARLSVGTRERGRRGAAFRRAGRRAAAGPRRRRGAHDPRCCGARARPACGCGPRRSTRASRPGAIASQFFGLPLEPGASEVVVGDALAVVRRELRALGARASAPALVAEGPGPAALGAAGWDAVVVDCFVGKGRSAELVDDIKGLLKPGGMVVHHMWHASPEDRDERVAPEFQATLQEYRRSFGPDRVEVQPIFRENPDLRLDDIILVHA